MCVCCVYDMLSRTLFFKCASMSCIICDSATCDVNHSLQSVLGSSLPAAFSQACHSTMAASHCVSVDRVGGRHTCHAFFFLHWSLPMAWPGMHGGHAARLYVPNMAIMSMSSSHPTQPTIKPSSVCVHTPCMAFSKQALLAFSSYVFPNYYYYSSILCQIPIMLFPMSFWLWRRKGGGEALPCCVLRGMCANLHWHQGTASIFWRHMDIVFACDIIVVEGERQTLGSISP